MEIEKIEYYEELLQNDYENVCLRLKEKYGNVSNDYFSEKSYNRLLNGEIKTASKNRGNTRTNEGLYIHHICENEEIMLSNCTFISKYKYPFKMQKADKLVYCNLIEHAVMHILISIEDSKNNFEKGKFLGIGGYINYIEPNIKDWYIDGNVPIPTIAWRQHCYEAAYLTKEEAEKLISLFNEKLNIEYL